MFESYRVAVQLSLVNGMTSGLIAITQQFSTLNKSVTSTRGNITGLEKELASLKRTTLVGGGLVMAGGAGLGMLAGPLHAATEYEKAYSRFKQFNLGELANKQADQFARATQVFGTSSADLMDALNMSMGVFGKDEMHMAYQVAPVIAQLNAANAGIFGGKVEGIEAGSFKAINRFIDMRGGAKDIESYMHNLDVVQKIISGSGGTIQFRDLEQFAKRGGTAFKGLSDEGLFNMMLSMQEMGGSTAGQSMMSMYQNLVAGRASKKAINALSSLGLVDTKMMTAGQLGGDQFQTLETTSVVGADMARTDPMGWLRKYVMPKIAGLSQDKQFEIVNSLFSNRNASNLGALGVSQITQIIRDANMGKGAMGVADTIANAKDNPANQFIEMQKKWNSLLTELGISILPSVIKATEGLIFVIKTLGALPGPIKTLFVGLFAVLSLAATTGGVIMLATAGFRALGLALNFMLPGATGPLALKLLGTTFASIAVSGVAVAALLTAVISFVNFARGKDASNWISQMAGVDSWTFGGKGDGKITLQDGTRVSIDEYNRTHGINGVASKRQQSVAPHTHDIVMDGRKVSEAVTNRQVNAASRPSAGTSGFDPTRMPAPLAIPSY